jgi:hypothetical protein
MTDVVATASAVMAGVYGVSRVEVAPRDIDAADARPDAVDND